MVKEPIPYGKIKPIWMKRWLFCPNVPKYLSKLGKYPRDFITYFRAKNLLGP